MSGQLSHEQARRSLRNLGFLVLALATFLQFSCTGRSFNHRHQAGDNQPLWIYDPKGGVIGLTVVESENYVLAALPEFKAVVALDPATGKERWRFTHEKMTSPGRPRVEGGLVFIANTDFQTHPDGIPGTFFVLDARTGKLLWQRESIGGVVAGYVFPLIKNGLLINLTSGAVTQREEVIEVFEVKTGVDLYTMSVDRAKWNATHPGKEFKSLEFCEDGRMVVMTTSATCFVADFRGRSIKELSFSPAGPPESAECVENTLYLTGKTGVATFVQAIDVATGKTLWTRLGDRPVELVPSLAAGKGLLLEGGEAGKPSRLVASDLQTGKDLWATEIPRASLSGISTGPAGAGLIVVRPDQEPRLLTIEVETGKIKYNLQTSDFPARSLLNAKPPYVAVISEKAQGSESEAKVTVFDLQTGTYLWNHIDDPFYYLDFTSEYLLVGNTSYILAFPLQKK
ncbi:MAG TPA: PQQ-binding-like beta-propeller repeat protein [Acidobacteriota bacterium]|nr:PQQ-binding-like beta-propeller repeat protein [Acidobacteriota bacterium]